MEVRIQILYDELNSDGSRASDAILRDINYRLGTEAIWEKYGEGWRAMA